MEKETIAEKIKNDITDILEDNPSLGRIGRVYQAMPQSVVLAVHDTHSYAGLQDRVMEVYMQMNKILQGYKTEIEALRSERDEAKKLARIDTMESFAEACKAYVKCMQQIDSEITNCQKRIYTLLNSLVRRTDESIIIGCEGAKTGEISFENIGNINVDKEGNLIEDAQTLKLLFNYSADRVIRAVYPTRVCLFGLEEADVEDAATSFRDDRLNIQRNKVAAESICNALRETQSPVGVLVFGASHFTTIKPTILDHLEQQGQPYIELIPSTNLPFLKDTINKLTFP